MRTPFFVFLVTFIPLSSAFAQSGKDLKIKFKSGDDCIVRASVSYPDTKSPEGLTYIRLVPNAGNVTLEKVYSVPGKATKIHFYYKCHSGETIVYWTRDGVFEDYTKIKQKYAQIDENYYFSNLITDGIWRVNAVLKADTLKRETLYFKAASFKSLTFSYDARAEIDLVKNTSDVSYNHRAPGDVYQ